MPDDVLRERQGDACMLGVSSSLSGRPWRARSFDETDVARMAREQGIPDLLARVMAGRAVAPEQAAGFLDPRLRDSFPDPSSFADMDLAAGLVWDAVEAGRRITVFADYDVDGATSAAQLMRWAQGVGAEFDHYVPDRIAEGYGPNVQAFDRLKERGTELVVTVDCGAAAADALKHAEAIGLDVIVIDHHLMDGDAPPAAALVNPNRPDDESGCGHLAAAGVTFVFLAALNREGRRRGRFETTPEPDLITMMDLACLGTICDVVPLTGLNRAIVAQGLKVMARWQWPGLRALAVVSGIGQDQPTPYHAGFLVGPRINAGGRVGQADLGVQLLTTDDEALAAELAGKLDGFNAERRQIEADVLDAAITQCGAQSEDRGVLIAAGRGWHPGVIGIVAGRVKDRFGKPAIVIGIDENAQPPLGKGSGRSVQGVNLGAAISAAREAGLLLSGGGHAMAGGLTVPVEGINALTEFLDERLAPELAEARDANALFLDGLVLPQAVDVELVESIRSAAPFGQGNAEPRFCLADLRVSFAQRVGSDHVRFTLDDGAGGKVSGICFRCADTPLGSALLACDERRYHAAGRIKLDEWRGQRRVQLHLEDLAAAD